MVTAWLNYCREDQQLAVPDAMTIVHEQNSDREISVNLPLVQLTFQDSQEAETSHIQKELIYIIYI